MFDVIPPDVSPLQSLKPRYYYLSGELRRAISWGIAGGVLIASVGTWSIIAVRQGGPAALLMFLSVIGLGGLWISQYLLARVRVDEMGIHRKILWWWDSWLWEDFSRGCIRDDAGLYSYLNPARSWWNRHLRLGLLEETDAKAINDLIRRIWVPPGVEPVPQQIDLRLKWPDRRAVRLTPEHLVISKKARETVYLWNEVTSVEFWRLTRDRNDFRELRLQLPDQEVHLRRWLHQGEEVMTWNGAASETIAQYIRIYVSPSRMQDYSLHDAPASIDELNARQQRFMRESSERLSVIKWSFRVCVGVLLSVPLFMPWPNSLYVLAIYSPLIVAAAWIRRDAMKTCQMKNNEFETQRKTLIEEASLESATGVEPANELFA